MDHQDSGTVATALAGPDSEALIASFARSSAGAETLESLTRPMLVLLETVTGLESTYLTTVDENAGLQRILYARNQGTMTIPEGLEVPWGDTLCQRALEQGRPYTDDVAGCWGDSDAARSLGIVTYMSQPVRTGDGGLYGTLCGASSRKLALQPEMLNVFTMFARMIAQQVDREIMLERARAANAELAKTSLTDPLTGIANRRAMEQELRRMLARAAREGSHVQVAFIDLDGFKSINDRYGHGTGDAFLQHIADKLAALTRPGDLVARTGGDEFVVLAPGEGPSLCERLELVTMGPFRHRDCALDYGGASVGVAYSLEGELETEAVLLRADGAMYEAKRRRKGGAALP